MRPRTIRTTPTCRRIVLCPTRMHRCNGKSWTITKSMCTSINRISDNLILYNFLQLTVRTIFRLVHQICRGQTPAEADLNLLETARRCELYGMKMHVAKDIEGVALNLAVAHMGIAVFQGITRINTFSWAKIRKISFKRKRFLIKLHQEGYGYYKDTVEFFFEGRNECKNFWKKCVENHGFFRCTAVQNMPRRKTRVLSRGSSFR